MLQRYANVYTSKLENFLHYPMHYVFNPERYILMCQFNESYVILMRIYFIIIITIIAMCSLSLLTLMCFVKTELFFLMKQRYLTALSGGQSAQCPHLLSTQSVMMTIRT